MKKLFLLIPVILIAICVTVYFIFLEEVDDYEPKIVQNNFKDPIEQEMEKFYLEISTMSGVTADQKMELILERIVNKYPTHHKAFEYRKIATDHNIIYNLPSHLENMDSGQLMYLEYRKFLEHHKNSPQLYKTLAKLGFLSYPEECSEYVSKALELNPSDVELYIIGGICYQILDDFDSALDILKDGNKIVVDKILNELKNKYPYSYLTDYRLEPSEVNYAKKYMRDLGYKPGKDVKYKTDRPKRFNLNKFREKPQRVAFMKAPPTSYTLSNGKWTLIKDLANLDEINYMIFRINEGEPIWYSGRRMPKFEGYINNQVDK